MSTTYPRSSLDQILFYTNLFHNFFDPAYIHHAPPNHHPNPQTKHPQRSKPNKPNNHHHRPHNGRRRHWGPQVRGLCSIVNILSPEAIRITLPNRTSIANGFFDAFRDAFSKREQADENLYVRQKEQEKLQELKKKIEDHKKHLDDLDKHVYAL